MKIIYENQLEDSIAFSEYIYKYSTVGRRAILKGKLLWGLGPIVGASYPAIKHSEPLIILAGVVIGIPMYFGYPKYIKWAIRKNIIKMQNEGTAKSIYCKHEIDIRNDGFSETTEVNNNNMSWSSVDKIAVTREYIYIFMAPNIAHIIHRDKIISGDYDLFANKLKEYYPKCLTTG